LIPHRFAKTATVPKFPLSRIATARSGDKGEGSNVGVLARSDARTRS